jgi:hypothetical protein
LPGLRRARSLSARNRKVPDGGAALDKSNDVDLPFTDVIISGGLNSRQLADEAVRRLPRLKVLFTIGYSRNAVVHHGRLDPGVHMIP